MHTARRAAAIEALGVPLGARPAKTVSDAARWEVRRGRVLKYGRGTYCFGAAPRTTLLYMRRRVSSYAAGVTTAAEAYERRRLNELNRAAANARGDEVSMVIDAVMATSKIDTRPCVDV